MFLMTSAVKIGDFKPFPVNTANWVRSRDDYSDSSLIKVPAIARMKTTGDTYEYIQTGLQFKEGMKVEVAAGYDGNNPVRFRGFVRRVNFNIPLEIECEGYSYQLRKKEGYTKSYSKTTVKQVLTDLCAGTDIVISDNIPEIALSNIYFRNVRGVEVLNYLKDKCLLTIYFDFNVLYAGLKMTEVNKTIKHRLNWNTVKDAGLKFDSERELATVNIKIDKRLKDGSKRTAKTNLKYGSVKTLKIRHIESEALLKEIAETERKKLLHKGYEGTITGFLFPVAEPGMADQLEDLKYPDRTGKYFIEKVEGSFSPAGGRQIIHLGAML